MIEKDLKDIVYNFLSDFQISDDNKKIIFWDKLLEKEDYGKYNNIIQSKVKNLLKLMNKNFKKGNDNFNNFLERDFHDDIWYDI